MSREQCVTVSDSGRRFSLVGGTVVDKGTGMVKPGWGTSLWSDKAVTDKWGSNRIKSVPPELKIIQRGKHDTHFEITPRAPMSPARFQELINDVEFE